MPNSIKYNTESEANALGIGNMHIGTGDVPKGPTSSTGFYNGINPPNGGYTIYLNKATQGPSIFTPSSDAELISVTNGIADATYTTINECFTYFAGQSDKIVMQNPINTLDTNGLTLYLNAAPLPSYPRSGDTCYDLSKDSNNADFYNGATFNSTLETMEFDGVNDYILTDNNVTITGDQSIETTIKFDSLEGFLQGLVSNHDYANTSNFGINQVQTNKIGISIGYTNGSREYQDKYSNTAVVTGRFYHIVMTFNLSANQCKLYIDGELDSTFNLTKTVKYTSRPMVLGRWDYQYTNYYFDGEISQAKYYSKTLSAEEVSLNYYQGQIITDGLVFAADAGNLVSYENGDTTTYSLTGSVDGTLTNGVGFNSSSGGYWEFDGVDDYIDIPFNSSLDVDYLTAEVWIKSDFITGPSTRHYIMNGCSHRWGVIVDEANTLRWYINTTSGVSELTWVDSLVSQNDWMCITCTFDGSSSKIYVNGAEKSSVSHSGTINTANSSGRLMDYRGNGYETEGLATNFKIYNRALTAAEVAQNYNANINRFN